VRRVFRWPLVLLPAIALVSGAILAFLLTDTGYDVTCCTQADIDQPWQPGTTVELRWTVESGGPNLPDRVFDRFENPTHKVSITAVLSGPYSDRAAVNQAIQQGPTGDIPAVTVLGSVTAMDDRSRPSTTPVTTFALPADLPAGYYDLTLLWEDGNGGIGDSRNIVRVGTQ
jgi:hypothetical protein